MVALYVRMIRKGTITIDDVPSKWRAQVTEALNNIN